MVCVKQTLDQRNHFWNMPRRAWNYVGPLATQCVKVFPECLDVFRSVVVNRQSRFLRFGNDAVFHVRDVHHVRDFVTLEPEITTENVRGHCGTKVSDVTVIPNSWTTVVKAHFALAHWVKLF